MPRPRPIEDILAERGFFGPNSAQYGQVGGTRTSERKHPTRKKKPGGGSGT